VNTSFTKNRDILGYSTCDRNSQGFTEYLVRGSNPRFATHFIHLCKCV